jgi:hypothetical protein
MAELGKYMHKSSFFHPKLQVTPDFIFWVQKVKVHQKVEEPDLFVDFENTVKSFEEVHKLSYYHLAEFIFLDFWETLISIMVNKPVEA